MSKMNKISPAGTFKHQNILITVIAVILISACASVPPPTEQVAISNEVVKNANSSDANKFAPLQLKSANEKMKAANDAMRDKKYELARQLSEQAQVDAQLAIEMERSAKAQKAADAIQEDNRVLRQEIDRSTK
jgi:hypothetical protein